jgi:inosine-uridine nucleoside N-ribohydrolase
MVDSKPRIGIIATTLVMVLAACGGADGKKPAEGSTSSNPVSGSDTVVEVPDTQFDGKTPVVVDTDMGGDDMMAILYLLQQEDVSLEAVTVTGTGLAHCPAGGANAGAILDHVGAATVPVACGGVEPLEGSNALPTDWRGGADELGTQLGLDVRESVESDAVGLLVETVKQSSEPVRLLAIGPLTNVAAAIDRDPEIIENLADIMIMGGAVDVSGSVEPAFGAEWNFWADPVAANQVLQSGVPITLMPLDATNSVPASVFFYEALTNQKTTPEAELVYQYFTANPFNLEGGAYFFWDVLAAAALVDPGVATYETRHLEVVEEAGERQGASVDSDVGAEVRVATGADRRRFEEGFLTALNDGTPAVVDVPSPHFTVRFGAEGCSLEGPTAFMADGTTATLVAEVANETDGTVAIVLGLHPGVNIEQVVADAARANELTETPSYWEETGEIPAFGAPLTGGSVAGRLDLVPGEHALVCATEENELTVVGDVVISPSTG